ncbi:MAG: 23S rRNA (pseudouridine(1915)-N(3))-methyltransferase RlmH [Parvibaculales bacterium]
MRVQISAIGTARNAPEDDMIRSYLKRLESARTIGISAIEVHEIKTAKVRSGENLKQAEGQKLLATLPSGGHLVALDERGKAFSSPELADYVQSRLSAGDRNLSFVLGGADGLDGGLRERADLKLSLGRMTFPHLLARVLLVEQLWRSVSILMNHPYHRE